MQIGPSVASDVSFPLGSVFPLSRKSGVSYLPSASPSTQSSSSSTPPPLRWARNQGADSLGRPVSPSHRASMYYDKHHGIVFS